jgi:catechol 2,3-dioxygenase-like lactoylglutathione lyase family enzyme
MGARFTELVIDCRDPNRVAEFWAAVLGYEVIDRGPKGEVQIGAPRAASGSGSGSAGPTLVFVPVPDDKTVKNRMHIDVNPTETDQSNELRRLIRLGARRVDVGQSPDVSWIVLADVEDNEFCLLRRRVEALS